MDAGTLAKAIEPFFSTKEIGKGTGDRRAAGAGINAQGLWQADDRRIDCWTTRESAF
jgi:hypothetical protein